MGQEFLRILSFDRTFNRNRGIIHHHLGHLPCSVIDKIAYDSEIHALLKRWEVSGLIHKGTTTAANSAVVCTQVTKSSVRVISDLRNINCPIQSMFVV